ncbi:sigma-70 family RNA polymerase sigma factor, partial [Cellulomonas sp.]|uniref:RNA polymerase sigma factor n=1 Tax=Cellulomonas sp. TaxID=40001 RepID=UPI001B0D628D
MSPTSAHGDIHRTIDAVWRMESARVIAGLVRMVRDVGLAEELAQDALVAALEKWPETGVPDNPAAWLTTTARNRAIDRLRHLKLRDEKHVQAAYELEQLQDEAERREEHLLDDPVGDDLLRLMFISCHPVLPPESRVALTLRLLGGLETGEIARAFLASEPTVAQRIVRAKRTLAEANVPFE